MRSSALRRRVPGRARFIETLATANGWRAGAELGVLRGDTFMHLLRACPALNMVGVDLWAPRPEMDALRHRGGVSYADHDLEGYLSDLSAAIEPYGERAALLRMRTTEAAKLFPDGHFDFVFIDADHTYEGVKADIEAWRPKARWILGHDYNERDFPGVVQAVEESFGRMLLFADHVWLGT